MNIFKNNINAFLLVFVSILVSVFFGTLIENFKSLIFLAFGAKILALLLWGIYVVPGIFLAKVLQYMFFTNFDPNIEMIVSLAAIASFTPVLMMVMMKISNAGNMFKIENINFRHIIFFIIISAMLSALFKHIYMSSDIDFAHNAAVVMLEALFGQLFGGLLFVYVASKYAHPINQIIKKLKFV
jgi:hypothetical protein